MKTAPRTLSLAVGFAVVLGGVVAAPTAANAASLTCDTLQSAAILESHGVKVPNGYGVSAGIHKIGKTRVCEVALWSEKARSTGLLTKRLTLSKNVKTLYRTEVERRATKAKSVTVTTYTAAGRKALKTKRAQEKTVRKTGKKTVRVTESYRNKNGATGTYVLTQPKRQASSSWKHTVSLTLVNTKGKKTTVKISERCDVSTGVPRCTGTQTSKAKKYRGAFDVRLKLLKPPKGGHVTLVSNGYAAGGAGKARYNRVYKLLDTHFEAQRNGFVGSRL